MPAARAPVSLVAIRADASVEVGSGHVMRCLALAERFQERGCEAIFLCRDVPGHLGPFLAQQGFSVRLLTVPASSDEEEGDAQATLAALRALPTPAIWMLVDHYHLGARWHRAVASAGGRIAVIDDLADRSLWCDVLVNQNATPALHARYADLLEKPALLLLGPRYTLLRREFIAAAEAVRSSRRPAGRLLVFLGGADSAGLTLEVLQQLQPFHSEHLFVLVGAMNPHGESIRMWCADRGVDCAVASNAVASLAVEAQAGIVACGMFAVELQALGIPCVLVPLSDIQAAVARYFEGEGNAVVVAPDLLRAGTALHEQLQTLLVSHPPELREPTAALDGARRVVEQLLEK